MLKIIGGRRYFVRKYSLNLRSIKTELKLSWYLSKMQPIGRLIKIYGKIKSRSYNNFGRLIEIILKRYKH